MLTVGFFDVLVNPLGPDQLYVAPLVEEFTFRVMPDKQARVPPVAVMLGAVLFSVTVVVAVTVQPEARVAVTTYCPPAFTTGFCRVEVKLLGPVHAQEDTVLLAVADNCADAVQVTVPFTEGVMVVVPALLPVSFTLSKKYRSVGSELLILMITCRLLPLRVGEVNVMEPVVLVVEPIPARSS